MTIHTFSENVEVTPAFAPAAFTNGTQAGVLVDTQADGGPYRRAAFVIQLNTGAATTGNFTLAEGDTTSPVTAVTGATLSGAQGATTSGLYILNVDLAKRKRYLKLSIVGTGTAGAASAEACLVEGQYLAPIQTNVTQVVTV